jgi:hypothetical protein
MRWTVENIHSVQNIQESIITASYLTRSCKIVARAGSGKILQD